MATLEDFFPAPAAGGVSAVWPMSGNTVYGDSAYLGDDFSLLAYPDVWYASSTNAYRPDASYGPADEVCPGPKTGTLVSLQHIDDTTGFPITGGDSFCYTGGTTALSPWIDWSYCGFVGDFLVNTTFVDNGADVDWTVTDHGLPLDGINGGTISGYCSAYLTVLPGKETGGSPTLSRTSIQLSIVDANTIKIIGRTSAEITSLIGTGKTQVVTQSVVLRSVQGRNYTYTTGTRILFAYAIDETKPNFTKHMLVD